MSPGSVLMSVTSDRSLYGARRVDVMTLSMYLVPCKCHCRRSRRPFFSIPLGGYVHTSYGLKKKKKLLENEKPNHCKEMS